MSLNKTYIHIGKKKAKEEKEEKEEKKGEKNKRSRRRRSWIALYVCTVFHLFCS